VADVVWRYLKRSDRKHAIADGRNSSLCGFTPGNAGPDPARRRGDGSDRWLGADSPDEAARLKALASCARCAHELELPEVDVATAMRMSLSYLYPERTAGELEETFRQMGAALVRIDADPELAERLRDLTDRALRHD
jgi:hypothetical protein